jgi:large subunit ribosomal protein L21
MYAIIEDSGRQYQVEEGQELDLDYRELSPGMEFKAERVLAYRDDAGLKVGQPTLDGVTVTAQVVDVTQGPKLVVQKMRRRKNYRRKTGHRQIFTRVKITKIEAV